MSPIPVSFTNRDLLRGTVVTPSWYRVRIESIGDGTVSSKGDSMNYEVEGTILFDSDSGDKKFENVPVIWNFNSKAMGFSAGLFRALGLEVGPDTRYDLKYAEGKDVDVFIENGEWQNKINNRVNHKYREPRKA